ncbi:hypothetical protein H4Q26_016896 [Puccinia striiformis f. sp. tritici PST-130]|nr:hypothetical protein H4Q26_016896 [Puccinia striiformis f. sp. tritici PST-130]
MSTSFKIIIAVVGLLFVQGTTASPHVVKPWILVTFGHLTEDPRVETKINRPKFDPSTRPLNMFKFFQTIAVGLLLLQVAMAFPATLDLRGRSVAKRQATGGGPIGGGNVTLPPSITSAHLVKPGHLFPSGNAATRARSD